MATSQITPPPGYMLEEPQGITPPPGYALEGAAPAPAPAPEPAPGNPPAPSEGYAAHYIKSLIDQTKQQWASGQEWRDREAQVIKGVTEAVKKGDFGGAAEILIPHLAHVAGSVAQGIGSNIMSGIMPQPGDRDLSKEQPLSNPIPPGPGVSSALKNFAAEEAAAPAAATATAAKPGLIQQIIKGKDVAQEPAQQAIRSSVKAGAEEPILQGNKTILDEPLDALQKAKVQAYSKMDEAAGFDVKAEETQLKNDLYKQQQLGNTVADQRARVRLTASIEDSKQRLADAAQKMQAAGIDPAEAKTLNTQWKAGQDIKKLLIKNTTADGASVNVDTLINDLKKAQFSKYGDRVQQFLGSEGGQKLMSDLMEAQKAGAAAIKVRRIAEIVAAAVGAGAVARGLSAGASVLSGQ